MSRRHPSFEGVRGMSLPYENATSGKAAIDEMQKILRAFGAASFGCMEDFEKGEVMVQFTWRERRVTIKASSKGYAARWLKEHPWTFRTKGTTIDHERKALKIGQVAVYSILRDWVKGQITAVEVGMLSFEGAFLGQIHLADGRTVLEAIETTDTLRLPGREPV
jgi:hypothetical protein